MSQNDNYGYHEIVHLSSVIETLWENEIQEHGAVQENPELEAAAIVVCEKLSDFYQLVSKIHFRKFKDKRREDAEPIPRP